MVRVHAHSRHVTGTARNGWRTRIASKAPKYFGAKGLPADPDDTSLTKLNGLKNKIVSAHKANDAVEVIRLWDEADRVYRALTKRGIRPLRKEMDKSHRWAINQLKRKDDAG
jgi:hypothetical protein